MKSACGLLSEFRASGSQTVNHECALVALFEDAASATHSSVYARLATRARQHGLDFFEQAICEAEDQKEPSDDPLFRRAVRKLSVILEELKSVNPAPTK
jgi:hypothetical protein